MKQVCKVAPQRNRVQAVPEVYGYTGVDNVTCDQLILLSPCNLIVKCY